MLIPDSFPTNRYFHRVFPPQSPYFSEPRRDFCGPFGIFPPFRSANQHPASAPAPGPRWVPRGRSVLGLAAAEDEERLAQLRLQRREAQLPARGVLEDCRRLGGSRLGGEQKPPSPPPPGLLQVFCGWTCGGEGRKEGTCCQDDMTGMALVSSAPARGPSFCKATSTALLHMLHTPLEAEGELGCDGLVNFCKYPPRGSSNRNLQEFS